MTLEFPRRGGVWTRPACRTCRTCYYCIRSRIRRRNLRLGASETPEAPSSTLCQGVPPQATRRLLQANAREASRLQSQPGDTASVMHPGERLRGTPRGLAGGRAAASDAAPPFAAPKTWVCDPAAAAWADEGGSGAPVVSRRWCKVPLRRRDSARPLRSGRRCVRCRRSGGAAPRRGGLRRRRRRRCPLARGRCRRRRRTPGRGSRGASFPPSVNREEAVSPGLDRC